MMFRQNLPTLVPPNFWTTQLLRERAGAPLTMASGSELLGSMLATQGGGKKIRQEGLWCFGLDIETAERKRESMGGKAKAEGTF